MALVDNGGLPKNLDICIILLQVEKNCSHMVFKVRAIYGVT